MDKTERRWLRDDIEQFGLQPGSPTSIGFLAFASFFSVMDMFLEWSRWHWLAPARHGFMPLLLMHQLILGWERRRARSLLGGDGADAVLRLQNSKLAKLANVALMLGFLATVYLQFFPTSQLEAFSAQPVGWMLLVVISVAFVVACYQAVRCADFIELSPDGLIFRRGSIQHIAWSEVASVEKGRNFFLPAIVLRFHRPRPVKSKWSFLSLWRREDQLRMGTELQLLPASFGVDAGDLYKALEPRVAALGIF